MSASKTEGVTASRVVEKNYFQSFWDQLVIMLRRNTILQIRYTRATLAQTVIAPFIFQLLLFILQQADYANQRQSIPHPTPAALPALTKCQGHNPGDPCITLMFAPDIPLYNQIVTEFGRMNGERGVKLNYAGGAPASLPNSLDIVGASSADFVYDYILANPNRTRWAITFNQPTATNYTNIQYQIWFNTSLTANSSDVFGSEMLTVTRGIDEAIMTVLNPGSTATRIDVTLKDWPKIPPSTLSDTVVQSLGPVFFFCTEMVIFINVLNQIVAEKEAKLRHGMEMMGLKPSVYWISHFLSNTLLVFVSSLVTTIFGLIFQFTAFKETHFMVLWITFFLFGLGMVMLAFFITTLVRRVRVAVLIGIFLFIIGLLFESFVFSSSFVGYIWWSKETMPSSGWQFLMFIPFFNFGHMFLDITMYTTGKLDTLTQTYIPGPGFQWSTLYNPLPTSLRPVYGSTSAFPDVPVPVQAWDFLIMNCFFYAVLVWYFDCVIPDEYGRKMPLWFFLTPDYWGIDLWRSKELDSKQWLLGITPKKDNAPSGPLDTDVVAERERALDENYWPAVKIVHLRKVYRESFWADSPNDKVAVKDTCLTFQEGKLLALLGQNGAGKSTTMSMLSGLTPPSSGDALIYNFSVKSQMHRIRHIMGVCPQHDILFDDLTAREHVELYAGLKGVPKEEWGPLVEERLKAVKLENVKDKRAGTYSGGMKRRLSLVISTIGDPKIVFMDEPTTGMDPVNRRHVWSFIEKFKKGRVIVLTTHSMEEADVLGDRIAIMAHGTLRAIGNSIALKNKFGAGYRIAMISDASHSDMLKQEVASRVPGASLEDDAAGALIYQFPIASTGSIPEFVRWLEGNASVVKTWGISQTTLEEVFLKLIRDANPKGYSGYEAR